MPAPSSIRALMRGTGGRDQRACSDWSRPCFRRWLAAYLHGRLMACQHLCRTIDLAEAAIELFQRLTP
jgi:hypothetical protein